MKEKIDYQIIYDLVKMIPSGRVATYGAIANALGIRGGARLVGYAMNAAHSHHDVPAHRVVNRNGLLTGRHHFSTPTEMEDLLKSEGVEVEDNQVKQFECVLWMPELL